MYEEKLAELMETQFDQLQQSIAVTATHKQQGEHLLQRCQQIQNNLIKEGQEFKTVSNCI